MKPRWRCAISLAVLVWPETVKALLAWQKPHLLLLDEPTNHLDLDMRDALTIALEEYTGAVIIVSHDRSLIRAVADELWLVADGEAKLFDGDLEDYKSWIESRRPREAATKARQEKPRRACNAHPDPTGRRCSPSKENSKPRWAPHRQNSPSSTSS